MSNRSVPTRNRLRNSLAIGAWVLALGLASSACGSDPQTSTPVKPTPTDVNQPPTDGLDLPETSPDPCPPSVSCDDGLSCTEDRCTMPEQICSWSVYPYTCLINGVCREPGEANPNNPCQLCDPVVDPMTWTAIAAGTLCEDGDACTTDESCQDSTCVSTTALVCDDGDACTDDDCDPFQGCQFQPIQSPCCEASTSLCNDNNPCTTDYCDENTLECENQPNSATCDDGDLCTGQDTCSGGSCAGSPKKCDDNSPCTLDLCNPKTGCDYQPLDGPECDDGLDCSTGDVCMGGTCVGNTSGCTCLPTFGDAVKTTSIQLGTGGHAGEGLDIDQKASSCAPASNCSGGIDNALGVLAGVVNAAFDEQLQAGIGILLMEFLSTDLPSSFQLALYGGALDPANPDCQFQQKTCDYLADGEMVDGQTCEPLSALPASLSGNTVVAGSTTSTFPFKSAMDADTFLEVTVHMVRLKGTVSWSGSQVKTFNGIVGGAIRKDELIAALNATPADQMPVDKNIVIGLIQFLKADMDTDNDGTKDALSVGLKVQAIDAKITGLF